MARAILVCGRIASGKSTYARRLMEHGAYVLLSVDEITLALFDGHIGRKHDDIVERTQKYLLAKSLELLGQGISVILDWGFWMRQERDEARAFYAAHGFACEFHQIDVSERVWRRNIEKRNREIMEGKTSAYFVDDALAEKFGAIYEEPERNEMDVWIINDWN
ncbi:MAG: ATP-binding protein [Clostridia bacterium]|nr:ATP-binding protein [Clostridia bacterium]